MVDHPARRRRHARRRGLQRHRLGAVGRLGVHRNRLGPVANDHHLGDEERIGLRRKPDRNPARGVGPPEQMPLQGEWVDGAGRQRAPRPEHPERDGGGGRPGGVPGQAEQAQLPDRDGEIYDGGRHRIGRPGLYVHGGYADVRAGHPHSDILGADHQRHRRGADRDLQGQADQPQRGDPGEGDRDRHDYRQRHRRGRKRACSVHRERGGKRGRPGRVHCHGERNPHRERHRRLRHRRRNRPAGLGLHHSHVENADVHPHRQLDDDLGADDPGHHRRGERDLHRNPHQQRRNRSGRLRHRHHQRRRRTAAHAPYPHHRGRGGERG